MTEQIRIDKITRINGGYLVEISTLDEPLQVTDLLFFTHRLKAGIVLTPPQLEQLVAEAENGRCEQVAGRLLGMRDHTVGELQAKLRQRKFGAESIAAAIKKYRSAGILDDARIATTLARQIYSRKPSGRSFLVATLQRKKIDRALAQQVVESLLESEDEVVSAVSALKQKWPRHEQIDIESLRTKAYSYLSRRGFGYQTAKEAVRHLFETDKETGR